MSRLRRRMRSNCARDDRGRKHRENTLNPHGYTNIPGVPLRNDTGLGISSPTWQFWSNPFSEPEGRHSLAAFSEPEGATQPSPDRKVGVREEYDGEPRRRRHKQGRKAATPLSSY